MRWFLGTALLMFRIYPASRHCTTGCVQSVLLVAQKLLFIYFKIFQILRIAAVDGLGDFLEPNAFCIDEPVLKQFSKLGQCVQYRYRAGKPFSDP